MAGEVYTVQLPLLLQRLSSHTTHTTFFTPLGSGRVKQAKGMYVHVGQRSPTKHERRLASDGSKRLRKGTLAIMEQKASKENGRRQRNETEMKENLVTYRWRSRCHVPSRWSFARVDGGGQMPLPVAPEE